MSVIVFEQQITAKSEHIDELGHVNNAVWVRWIQDVATAHWGAAAAHADQEAYVWVVTRHEIDYLRAVEEGDTVTARTWIDPISRGARSTRHMEFVGEDGKTRVKAVTNWAIIDKAAGRPIRIPEGVLSPFVSPTD